MVILCLPLIQKGQLSVSGERLYTSTVNRLEDKACTSKSVLKKTHHLDKTLIGLTGPTNQTKQKKQKKKKTTKKKKKNRQNASLTYADSEFPDQFSHLHSLIRAFAMCLQNWWLLHLP